MMTLGNEMGKGRETRAEVIRSLREVDPTRLYAQASNYDFRELVREKEDDYWTTVRTAPGAATAVRGSFSHADLPLGHIQVVPPSTDYDYTKAVALSPVPVIGHETGQFQVYPNFDEMSKYTGVQKPWNLEVFAARLKTAGMYDQRKDFFKASGALTVLSPRDYGGERGPMERFARSTTCRGCRRIALGHLGCRRFRVRPDTATDLAYPLSPRTACL
jgi:hypothetical protein